MPRSVVASRSAQCYALVDVKQTPPYCYLTYDLVVVINGILEVSITALGGQTLGLWKL